MKQLPKVTTAISFLIFLAVVFALFQGRKSEWIRLQNIDNFLPEFYSHISNFCLSYILYSGIGYFWIMAGVKFKYIVGLGIVILASNFIFELFINVLNTPDIIDAYYGVTGTLFALLFLFISYKFGFKAIKPE
ncbi:hypothetical protein H4O20_05165 [Aequorivita sp. 609]|uniref:hypothetical protein n=1 Tax=Aequorivita TaxID=153265 RepID=UPI0011219D46|nr:MULTISPECIES: hypothetical protein [Aequorivita]MBB6680826.1 hypothetical protein [Aequorivita sp. 609]